MKELFYHSLKTYCRTVLNFYFKKIQIHNIEPVPPGPVIFVSNHQNAFLDAIVFGCTTYRTPWFLTRANVFQKDFVKKIFHTLKMTPVYRFRDGFGTLRKNDEVIENCIQLLGQGECILLFGEGNHDEHWRLRPLQKGFARIAIAAEERNNWSLGLTIVPVGLQYDSHSAFRSRVLVTTGTPISVKKILPPNLSTPEQLEFLVKQLHDAIEPLMLHIEQPDYEKKRDYFLQNRIIKSNLIDQLKSDQEIVSNTPPASEIKIDPNKIIRKSTPWWNPIFIYSFINHLLPRSIIHAVIKSKVKDPQFIGSLKFAMGMVLVPFFYLVQASVCLIVSGSWTISAVYLLSLPISVLLRD